MIGWKQAYNLRRTCIVLVKLEIPDGEKIVRVRKFGLTQNFYRCERARVLDITTLDGTEHGRKAVSLRDADFFYEVGKEVYARRDRFLGRHPGIHFFASKEEAQRYEY